MAKFFLPQEKIFGRQKKPSSRWIGRESAVIMRGDPSNSSSFRSAARVSEKTKGSSTVVLHLAVHFHKNIQYTASCFSVQLCRSKCMTGSPVMTTVGLSMRGGTNDWLYVVRQMKWRDVYVCRCFGADTITATVSS